MTRKQENEKMRNSFIKELMDFIESQGNEAIRIKNNEVAFPIVYENGDEAFMKIAVSRAAVTGTFLMHILLRKNM